ncbi:hypothetical protein JCM8097_000289 [Rhodosporidiobolus ruineniae]
MGLSQDKVGKLFRASTSAEETEEILMAYAFSKWQDNGSQQRVLRKLHLLTHYLRAVDLGLKLRDHYQAFAITASLARAHPEAPVIVLPSTPLGVEAWNAARRPSKSVLKRAFSRGTAVNVVSPGTGSSENSDAELEGASGPDGTASTTPRRPPMPGRNSSSDSLGAGVGGGGRSFFGAVGGRSRSNTTVTAVIVASGTQEGEQTRRTAGAGARDGLGTGLLSAPPNYDGRDLAEYIDSDPTLRNTARAYDPEVDMLPSYA